MTHVGYLVAGYSITFGAVAVYVAWVVARSRSLSRALQAQAPDRPRADAVGEQIRPDG